MAARRYRFFHPAHAVRLKGLELTVRGVVEGVYAGLHKSPHRGFSIEFAEHREYVPGDEIKHLDWTVLARSDRYYVKQYEQETNLRATICLDASGSMGFNGTSDAGDGKKARKKKVLAKAALRGEGQSVTPNGVSKFEYAAVLAAEQAALQLIRQGATGSEIDRAAREVLRLHGFEKEFTHGTGHGVGFGAISPEARPRLHPMSGDVLEPGMVFNVEPAVYLPGYAGLRQCSMIGVGPMGPEILTPMQRQLEELVIRR